LEVVGKAAYTFRSHQTHGRQHKISGLCPEEHSL
jgi:hypothetical protein